jgi:hypothetical protein
LTLEAYPEGRAEGLYVSRARVEGGAAELKVPPGELVYASACPWREGVLDLSSSVDLTTIVADGVLSWEAPEGEWEVFGFSRAELYEGTHATSNVFLHQPYINLLDARATEVYIRVNHEQYAERIPDLSDTFEATFTDEPSLMALFFKRQPYPAIPWSAGLASSFHREKGYDLVPLLPALVADGGEAGHRARCDYWDHVGELTAEGFFGQIAQWCREHDIPSGGHLLMEEHLDQHIINYGDFYRCAELLGYPSMDCLTSLPEQVPWHVAKLLGSIAHRQGAPVVMSETSDHVQRYRPEGDDRPVVPVTADQIRGTCGMQFVGGVTTITSYYSYAGLSTQEIRELNEWVARCETLLRGTGSRAEIGVLYPVESGWAAFTPATQGATSSERLRRIDGVWLEVQEALFENQRDYSVVDSRAIAEGSVEDGALRCGELTLRTVILPATDTLRVEALERLAELVDAGGLVVFCGDLPMASLTRTDDPRCHELLRGMLGAEPRSPASDALRAIPSGSGGGVMVLGSAMVTLLPRVLDDALPRDVEVTEGLANVRVTHRQKDGRELYFLMNSSAETIRGQLTLAAEGQAWSFEPETGEVRELGERRNGAATFEVELPGYAARGIALERADAIAPTIPDVGDLRLATADLPRSEMRGEPACAPHVEGTATAADMHGRPGTFVEARIGETDVDSWCFAMLDVAPGTLGGWEGVRVPIFIPEGQEGSAPRFFVIAVTQDGGEFIAPLNRSLSEPGWATETVWWSDLDRTAWSESDAPLDPARIAAFSIGWGGYFGTAGEEIQFGLGALECVRVAP